MKNTLRTGLGLSLATLGASACTAILGGFDYNGGTGGHGSGGASSASTGTTTSTGSTSTSASSSTSTSSTGSGGTGGAAPKPTCSKFDGGPVQILAPSDFGTQKIDENAFFLVPDPGTASGRHMVHVYVGTQAGQTQDAGPTVNLVRTVTDQMSSPVGNLITLSEFGARAGTVLPGSQLYLQGNQYSGGTRGLGQMTIELDPMAGVQAAPAPTFTNWTTPTDCTQMGGYVSKVSFAPDAQDTRYVVACVQQQNDAATLWIGSSDPTIALTQVASGQKQDSLMNPASYAYLHAGATHFVAFQGGGNGPSAGNYSYGSTATDLAAVKQFQLEPNKLAIPLALAPLPTEGFTLFFASIDQGLTTARLWGGSVTPADLPKLGMVPPPTIKALTSNLSVNSFAPLNSPAYDATNLYAAGATFDGASVNLSWTLRDGTPLLMESTVYTTTNTILSAAAAPLGLLTLVVWAESTPAGAITVYAQRMHCTM